MIITKMEANSRNGHRSEMQAEAATLSIYKFSLSQMLPADLKEFSAVEC